MSNETKHGSHSFVLKSKNNDSKLTLSTEFWDNGDGAAIFTVHTFFLQSYSRTTEFVIYDAITPEILRKFADELDEVFNEVVYKNTKQNI